MPIRVAVYGATGYTGVELLRYLYKHPEIKIVAIVSSTKAGRRLSEVLPSTITLPYGSMELVSEPGEDYDLAFLCLPHEVSLELAPRLLKEGKRVIDLSGAYRIKESERYPEYYGFEHTHVDLLNRAVYGLPEIFRDRIKGAELIANPGCYPTATLLALYPLTIDGIEFSEVVVHALSGISGAGRKPKQSFHYPEMEGGFFSYSVGKHRHTPEMESVLGELSGRHIKLRFTPTVVPTSRGMLSTAYVKTGKDLSSIYRDTYSAETFIKVIDTPPNPKWVLGTNFCLLYATYDSRTGYMVIQSAIDNLGKGASSQAVQNVNIMFGFEESTSLEVPSIFP